MGMEISVAAGAGPAASITVEHIEVTQAIQDLAHSVLLIAEKSTVVRVCVGTSGSAIRIRGELQLENGTQRTTVGSLNEVFVDPTDNGQIGDKRVSIQKTLNFIVPLSFNSPGTLEISLVDANDATTGESVSIEAPTQTRAVTFNTAVTLRIAVIGFRYHAGSPGTTFVPRNVDVRLLESWLRRAYPISELDFSYRVVESNFQWPFSASLINTQVAALRNQDVASGTDARTHYYGLVYDGGVGQFMRGLASGIPMTPDPSTVASGPTGSGSNGWDFDGSYGDWYGGHEIAHTFGRFHPGFCNGNSRDDLNYPYAGGLLTDPLNSFVGFDFGNSSFGIDMQALPGSDWHDVMTYCDHQWLSDYTYQGIYDRLIAEDNMDSTPSAPTGSGGVAMNPSPANNSPDPNSPSNVYHTTAMKLELGDFLNVVGTVNLTRSTGKIRFVSPVGSGMQPVSDVNSNVSLRFLDAGDSVLNSLPVDVKRGSCRQANEDEEGIIDAVVPRPAGSVAVEITIDDRVVDRFGGSKNVSPVANIRRINLPASQPNVAGFAWDSSESTDPNVTYIVQFSKDDGATWNTVSIGRPTPDVDVDKSEFADAKVVKMRVIATDGFEKQTVDIDSIDVD